MKSPKAKLPTFTISDAAAISRIRAIIDAVYGGPDEPINGCDAVDSLIEIKTVLDAAQFLPKKAGR